MCRFAHALPLRQFMHRRRVLMQFRALLRTARTLGEFDPASGADVRRQVSTEFRRWAADSDKPHCMLLLADGERQLATLQGLLEATRSGGGGGAAAGDANDTGEGAGGEGAAGAADAGGAAGWAGAATKGRPTPPQAARPTPVQANTWYGQGPPDDVHGRVGEAWPWGRD